MLRDGSVEEEILITIQQADDTGAVVCGGSNHLQSVSTLKVRLDHFVVLPITKSQRFQMGAPQPVKIDAKF